ncbi:MAG: divergent polysaccharide deacetylase family protein [Ancalomicrobiaceae bacterium]|nr:divergent polysaccharide deacetylase family protein [Ancalomicrobiaceae bacterium]
MPNDLKKPLGLKTIKNGLLTHLPLGLIGATILSATVLGAAAWIAVVRDPLGGEPVTYVRIDRTKTGLNPKDVAFADPKKAVEPQPMPAAVKPDDDEHPDDPSKSAPSADEQAPTKRPPPAQIVEGQPLTSSPIAKITERGRYGLVPKIAADGSRPVDLYARPAPALPSASARVVIIVGGLGLSQTTTQEAIRLLPPAVTLAFAPYGSSLDRWMQRGRQEGHELLLQVPMEPFDYPDTDPGPHTLLTTLTPEQNADRLQWLMARFTDYVGVVNYTGAKFTAATDKLEPVLKELGQRGVMFLDDGSSSRSMAEGVAHSVHTPFARADLTIDGNASEAAIDTRLTQLENLARSKGLAIGMASALPLTVRRISQWTKTLESRGVTVIPLTAAIRSGQM